MSEAPLASPVEPGREWHLTTDRLTIRPVSPADAGELAALYAQEDYQTRIGGTSSRTASA